MPVELQTGNLHEYVGFSCCAHDAYDVEWLLPLSQHLLLFRTKFSICICSGISRVNAIPGDRRNEHAVWYGAPYGGFVNGIGDECLPCTGRIPLRTPTPSRSRTNTPTFTYVTARPTAVPNQIDSVGSTAIRPFRKTRPSQSHASDASFLSALHFLSRNVDLNPFLSHNVFLSSMTPWFGRDASNNGVFWPDRAERLRKCRTICIVRGHGPRHGRAAGTGSAAIHPDGSNPWRGGGGADQP